MARTELFVGSTNRLYLAGAYTLDAAGTQTAFTSSSGALTAQVLNLDGTSVTDATAMTYTAGSAVVNGTTYASGNWSLLLASDTDIAAGTQYVVEYVGTLSGNTIPDLTLRVQVVAQYAD